MQTVAGYFDGKTCIPFDPKVFRPNQRVIITGLDEYVQPSRKHEQSVSSLVDELTGILGYNKNITAEEIRKERLEKKYDNSARH
ncbi:MAG: hypothetical protein WCR31_02550 [Treponema sp.]